MHAPLSVDQADQLTHLHKYTGLAFRIHVVVIGALVLAYVVLGLADDLEALPPSPYNTILFVILVGTALAVHQIHTNAGTRLGQLVIAQEFASALAGMPLAGQEVARLYAAVGAMQRELTDHIEDTRELPVAVTTRSVATYIPLHPSRPPRRRRPIRQRSGADVIDLPTQGQSGIDPDAIQRVRRINERLKDDH